MSWPILDTKNADGSVQHVICEGSREHVLSWHLTNKGAITKCSHPKCEVNVHGSIMVAVAHRKDLGDQK